MPDLTFEVEGAQAVRSAALALKLSINNADEQEAIHTIVLRCQVQIEAPRRRYNAGEQGGQTLRSILWTHTSVVVPPFTAGSLVEIQLPCTFDFSIATTKYFAGLEEGEIPLTLLFSGTIFYKAESGMLQVSQIPWEKDGRYRLPVRVWREMMDIYYPNTAWLCTKCAGEFPPGKKLSRSSFRQPKIAARLE